MIQFLHALEKTFRRAIGLFELWHSRFQSASVALEAMDGCWDDLSTCEFGSDVGHVRLQTLKKWPNHRIVVYKPVEGDDV